MSIYLSIELTGNYWTLRGFLRNTLIWPSHSGPVSISIVDRVVTDIFFLIALHFLSKPRLKKINLLCRTLPQPHFSCTWKYVCEDVCLCVNVCGSSNFCPVFSLGAVLGEATIYLHTERFHDSSKVPVIIILIEINASGYEFDQHTHCVTLYNYQLG